MSLHLQIYFHREEAIPGARAIYHRRNTANEALTKVTLELLAFAAAVLKEHIASRADYTRSLDALESIRVGAKVASILGRIEHDRELARGHQLGDRRLAFPSVHD